MSDLIIGARHADAGARNDVGKTYVIFGGTDLPPTLDLSRDAVDLVVVGRAAGDRSGHSVAAADVNGDGSDDLIIGAPGADPIEPVRWLLGRRARRESIVRSGAGKTYVIYGGEGLPKLIDLAAASADVTIDGVAANDRSGSALATGDLNGDDTDDLIITAPYADAADRSGAGATYVVFGRADLPSAIDLKSEADFTLYGREAYDSLGSAVASAELNEDEFDDLIVGAPGADVADREDAGETYVLHGRPDLPSTFDLNGTQADVTVAGGAAHDRSGSTLTAGDVNADGRADLVIGAPGYDAPNRPSAGAVYVLYGDNLPQTIDLSATAADFVLLGDDESDRAGDALAVPDANGDGLSYLIVGAPNANPAAGAAAGETYVIQGRSDLPPVLDLDATPADLTLFGGHGDDRSGSALVVGDLNGDGLVDLIIGAPGAAPGDRQEAGAVYAVYGQGNVTPTPTPVPTSTPSSTPSPTPPPPPTDTPAPLPTPVPSPSPTPPPTSTPAPTNTPSPEPSPPPPPTDTPAPPPPPEPSPSPTAVSAPTETGTPTLVPSIAPSETPSPTASPAPSPTDTPAPSPSATTANAPDETATPPQP